MVTLHISLLCNSNRLLSLFTCIVKQLSEKYSYSSKYLCLSGLSEHAIWDKLYDIYWGDLIEKHGNRNKQAIKYADFTNLIKGIRSFKWKSGFLCGMKKFAAFFHLFGSKKEIELKGVNERTISIPCLLCDLVEKDNETISSLVLALQDLANYRNNYVHRGALLSDEDIPKIRKTTVECLKAFQTLGDSQGKDD